MKYISVHTTNTMYNLKVSNSEVYYRGIKFVTLLFVMFYRYAEL